MLEFPQADIGGVGGSAEDVVLIALNSSTRPSVIHMEHLDGSPATQISNAGVRLGALLGDSRFVAFSDPGAHKVRLYQAEPFGIGEWVRVPDVPLCSRSPDRLATSRQCEAGTDVPPTVDFLADRGWGFLADSGQEIVWLRYPVGSLTVAYRADDHAIDRAFGGIAVDPSPQDGTRGTVLYLATNDLTTDAGRARTTIYTIEVSDSGDVGPRRLLVRTEPGEVVTDLALTPPGVLFAASPHTSSILRIEHGQIRGRTTSHLGTRLIEPAKLHVLDGELLVADNLGDGSGSRLIGFPVGQRPS